jgi:hypothetical protein
MKGPYSKTESRDSKIRENHHHSNWNLMARHKPFSNK